MDEIGRTTYHTGKAMNDESHSAVVMTSAVALVSNDRVDGFWKAREIAGDEKPSESDAAQELEQLMEIKDRDGEVREEGKLVAIRPIRDPYAKLLRFIVHEQPSDTALLDWMIAQEDAMFTVTSGAVLANDLDIDDSKRARSPDDDDITPIWCLLSILLYPELTLRALIDRLRRAGVGESLIVKSIGLVGAQLGAIRL